jgi:hypothetical protein
MTNFSTIKSITDNLQTVLKGLGINFTCEMLKDGQSVSVSLLPLGQIFYDSETFEYTHGEKPEYIEVAYNIRILLQERNATDTIREQQRWVHTIRDALTVSALNIGDLASSKLVSKVTTEDVSIDNTLDSITAVDYTVLIRYREL